MRKLLPFSLLALALPLPLAAAPAPACVTAERLFDGPIIHAGLDPSTTGNIQGPSLIRVPDWVKDRLGRYYLYFASHKGDSIRLAYADHLAGPWKIHPGGTLKLSDSLYPTELAGVPPEKKDDDNLQAHIASPDVHVDEANHRILLYYHGILEPMNQKTRVAVSTDGTNFTPRPELLGPPYFRVFQHGGYSYAMAMPGILFRSKDGLSGFERGPTLFERDQRHTAILKRGNQLLVFWTRAGDAPERIYLSRIDISGDWSQWKASEPEEILRPEFPWEGADAPVLPSQRGTAFGHLNQLRDPAIFEENGETYLLYAVAGESGIAAARLHFDDLHCAASPSHTQAEGRR